MLENTGVHGRHRYNGCFVFIGDLRYDSRLQNILRSLSKRFSSLALVQAADANETFRFENCDVMSLRLAPSLRGARKFLAFYRTLFPAVLSIDAEFYCAEDVFSLPVAARAAARRRATLLYDSRELFFALAQLKDKRLKQTVWSSIERRYISRARVFTSGELDSQALAERYHIPVPTTIYNYPAFREIQRNQSLREKLNLSSDRVLLIYQGILTEGRGISKSLDALKKLDERFVLVLIGDGDLRQSIEKKITEMNLSSRAFVLGRVPHGELLNLTASADIGLALIEPISESYKLALPNKLFEYVLCSVPVVASNLPAMQKVIDKYRIGITVDADSNEDLTNAISLVAENIYAYQRACLTAKLRLNWQTQETQLWSLFEP
ncbi:MAG: hypothetical protein HY22_06630 [[Candidatus Thermochlorobacteriaceae] bacterium GBChlB]|nr:MAG: hypothetical protein HY22_06630 [[Candidatus Thermochlorobacteriaceae] bacterium GBChlB]